MSAPVRLIPTPPDRVLRINAKYLLSLLNLITKEIKVRRRFNNCHSPFHETLSHFYPCASIEPHVHIAVVVEEGLKHIEHLRHLSEDQHPVAPGLEGAQQVGKDLELSAVVLDQPGVRSLHCEPVDQVMF